MSTTAQTENVVDVQALINDQPLSIYQWMILILGFLIVAADGFDTAAIGFIAPALVDEWGIPRSSLGPVLSAALVGLAIGALTSGPIADRIGRKTVLVTSVFFFGVWSIASAYAPNLEWLTFLRFMTGLGLGAAMPNAATLISEYAPARCRSLMVNTMFCGFTLGSSAGGFAAAWLIPHHGWHSVLLIGGIIPVALALLLIFILPESVRFMIVRNWSTQRIARILTRIAPQQAASATRFTLPEQAAALQGKSSFSIIFSSQHIAGTLLLWLTYFMGLLIFYLLTSWLPILIKDTGYTLQQASLVTALFPLGGGLGALAVGWLMDRMDSHIAIAGTYILTGILIFAVGHGASNITLLCTLVFAAGLCMNGAQTSLPALAAAFYPTQGRATGVAWMLGIGRFGGITGAMVGATIMSLGWSFTTIFTMLTLPAVIAAIALILKQRSTLALTRESIAST